LNHVEDSQFVIAVQV